jgi:cytidylate kinase
MFLQSETNIIISGMASSGTSTTALILAYILNKKFLYAGGILKFIAGELGYDPKSKDFLIYEKKYGAKWDILWDKYAAWKLLNEKNILLDAKLGGYMVDDQPWIFEVFVKPTIEARLERAGGDKRSEDILGRDLENRSRWKKIYGIADIYDSGTIREHYDFLVDNTELTIAETVFQIYNAMRGALGLKDIILKSDLEKLETIIKLEGKQFFYNKLEEKGNLITPKDVFKDWREYFAEELDQTEPEWKAIVLEN